MLVGSVICKRLSVSIHRDSCISMFIVALFTIARKLDQPRCPSADDWIKRMRHVDTMELYAA